MQVLLRGALCNNLVEGTLYASRRRNLKLDSGERELISRLSGRTELSLLDEMRLNVNKDVSHKRLSVFFGLVVVAIFC
jgi:hypothetical protein